METKTDSLDLLSSLLAMENITVLRERVPTASFDIKNRVLRVPILINMNNSEELLFRLHEVGHALYTDESYMTYIQMETGRKAFRGYMNILEDVRIERMIKKHYPGCRKDFYSGYASLNDRNFFGIENKDLSKYTLIDRINIFYKVGFKSGVRFTPEEMVFVREADETNTLADVYQLAKRVYDFAKEQAEKKKQQNPEEIGDEESDEDSMEELVFDGDDIFGDSESDDIEYGDEEGEGEQQSSGNLGEESEEGEESDEKQNSGGAGSGNIEDDIAPETQESFDRSLNNNIEAHGRDVFYVAPEMVIQPLFEEYRIALNFMRAADADKDQYVDATVGMTEKYQRFKRDNQKAVAHLVKEFEMRKAATRYARTQTAQTGSLSMNKIHGYKTGNDLFKKLNIVADDQNHGFLMLLDWSGSMDLCLSDAVGQVITLAQFCRRVNIPFKVVAFSDGISTDHYNKAMFQTKKLLDGIHYSLDNHACRMITFLDSKMSGSEFEYMSEAMYTLRILRARSPRIPGSASEFVSHGGSRIYDLNGTPLGAALTWAYQYLDEFKKSIGVEKMTFVTVTDGDGGEDSFRNTKTGAIAYRRNGVYYLRDQKTGRVVDMDMDNRHCYQHAIVKLIGKSGVNTVGFFIARKASYGIRSLNTIFHVPEDYSAAQVAFRKSGYYEYSTGVYNKFFMIPSSYDNAEVNLDNINGEMTAAQISRSLKSAMSDVTKSRIVLTKFIEQIS
jgi:hypothetical protein